MIMFSNISIRKPNQKSRLFLQTGQKNPDVGEKDIHTGEKDIHSGGKNPDTGIKNIHVKEKDIHVGEKDIHVGGKYPGVGIFSTGFGINNIYSQIFLPDADGNYIDLPEKISGLRTVPLQTDFS